MCAAPAERGRVHIGSDHARECRLGRVPQEPADPAPHLHDRRARRARRLAIRHRARDSVGQRLHNGEQVAGARTQEDGRVRLLGRVHAPDDLGRRHRSRVLRDTRSVGAECGDGRAKILGPTVEELSTHADLPGGPAARSGLRRQAPRQPPAGVSPTPPPGATVTSTAELLSSATADGCGSLHVTRSRRRSGRRPARIDETQR